ncbi:DMT family transporter [Rhizobium sp. KVB221]|uniref:DMT family transporter n=1 Tax=Rhizobium setariae TaxID=2801340 RepID=A0A936YUA6_9HYPH|nr:DMT family transporter [Rhizobium setariae]MBL0375137.1 DMT family transporter [Rhizobium setariae]
MNTSTISPASPASTASRGVIIMLVGMLMFALNDVLGKWLVATYPVGQVIFMRSVAALIVLSPFLWWTGFRKIFAVEKPMMQASRVVFSTFEVFAFYAAVVYLPLADVMTYWLAAPVYVAALAPLLLGEKVGWRRWTAIAVGFLGVIVALEPSSAMLSFPAAISIIGSMAMAFMLMSGRTLRNTPDTVLVFWQIVGAGLAGLCTLPFGWVMPGTTEVLLLGLLGVVAMSAHMLVNRALKLADAATVAPLQYTLLFWAIVFGWMVFNDMPSVAMLIGAALIVGSGLYIFFRERALKKTDLVLPAFPE